MHCQCITHVYIEHSKYSNVLLTIGDCPCVMKHFLWWCQENAQHSPKSKQARQWRSVENSLTLAPVGWGLFLAPSSLFAIYLKLLRRSSRDFQFPLVNSFYILCSKIVPESMIGWPQMTSAWRHVQPFSKQKKVPNSQSHELSFVCVYFKAVGADPYF